MPLSFDGIEPTPLSGIVSLLADLARTHYPPVDPNSPRWRKKMSANAVGLSLIDGRPRIGTSHVLGIGDKLQVGGVATGTILAQVVKDGDVSAPANRDRTNKPGVHEAMNKILFVEDATVTIARPMHRPGPDPATGDVIHSDTLKQLCDVLGGNFVYSEKSELFHNRSVALAPIYDKEITETMSLQGSFFMLTRERYWALKISDEETFGSWGSQGIEVACKTWLSGGRVVCNRKTWYAHMFRTQGGDFGFPYKQDGSKVQAAKKKAREVFFDNKFELQTRPLSWLLEKFWPVPGWTDKQLKELQAWPLQNQKKPDGITKGAAYYTDNKLPKEIAVPVFKNLEKVFPGKIKAVSLAPLSYTKSTVLDKERGYLTMFEQILTALRGLDTDIVFMTEHDVLYHPSHFDFVPIKGTFHYNTNVWKVRIEDGHALWVDNCRQVSGLCAWREDLIAHYEERVSYVREKGYSNKMGFEPGTHSRITWKRQFKCDTWMSAFPNVDIRHQANLTPNRWSPDLFRDKRNCEGWKEAEKVPGWGKITISTLNGNLR